MGLTASAIRSIITCLIECTESKRQRPFMSSFVYLIQKRNVHLSRLPLSHQSVTGARKQSNTFKWIEVPMLWAGRKMGGGKDTALVVLLLLSCPRRPLTSHAFFFQNITKCMASFYAKPKLNYTSSFNSSSHIPFKTIHYFCCPIPRSCISFIFSKSKDPTQELPWLR